MKRNYNDRAAHHFYSEFRLIFSFLQNIINSMLRYNILLKLSNIKYTSRILGKISYRKSRNLNLMIALCFLSHHPLSRWRRMWCIYHQCL